MSIALIREQGKARLEHFVTHERVFMGCAMLLAFGAFGIGRLYGKGEANAEIILEFSTTTAQTSEVITSEPPTNPEMGERAPTEGQVVASKNSTKFHYPWCPGASQIKNENKIFFTNESDALAAGFTKAANCN
ncbi:MAG: hypothetical protein AAB458_00240 [Patescibacteria group bacterium]